MAGSLRHLDFSDSVLIAEAMTISANTQGAFSYQDLRDMEFPEYEKIVARVKKELEARNE